ncbi:MAG TPA: MarR family winged helix-turn-helix transcriptional regulator [Candidatus Limnocylindrales bacterium]|nr:MarR family winged helix-turn-helix transcriptional regulator [Candidatus Limnocylindrales bacterium]
MEPHANLAYLIHHVATLLERQAEKLLQERFAIGFSQFKILMALKWKTNVQQRQIADSLGQTEASVSRQIKMLQEQGLLANRISPENRRQRIISLTAKGDKLAQAAMTSLTNYQQTLFAGMGDVQRSDITTGLQIIHRQLCQTGACGS